MRRRGCLTLFAVLALGVSAGCARVLHISYAPLDVQAAPPGVPAPPPPPPVKTEQIHITERVEFETDSAKLQRVSHKVLDQVVEVLRKNPDIELIEVQGHTDNTGTADHNRQLSQARAESVRDYLVTSGKIAAARVQAKGYGQDRTLASNDTAEGKQKNRRVEFHILRRAKGGTP
jgi:outer membrane protein OmpA-like peptidoglycan-associated protein